MLLDTALPSPNNRIMTIRNQSQRQQRFNEADQAIVGFRSLLVNGVPIVADNKCTASHLFLLNEKYLELRISSKDNFEFIGWQKKVDQPGAMFGVITVALNLMNLQPRSMYKFTAITG